ncbi:MAG: hypothetical protein QOJ16_1020, partial [Acidobacteriota bacterium]|nr:hypothetical protein [Acidobacteriota bacterium]
SYAWDKTHANELFDDLETALTQDEEYFLGSVVITKAGNSGTPEVVDGQQRLATSVIFLAAIRDYLLSIQDEEWASDIEAKFLLSRQYPSREVLPQLSLNAYDHEYYLKRVLYRPGTDERMSATPLRASHRRIHANAQVAISRVKKIIAGATPEQRNLRLSNWIDYLRDRARLIVVLVPDDTHAYIMFETLNDRGLELSKVDLLKNYLFGRSGPDRQRETEQRWHSMIGVLESVGQEEVVSTYVRHLWASMHGPTRDRELFARIKAKVKSKNAVVQLASDLAENANTYAALLNPSHSLWGSYGAGARRHIETLLLLRMEQVRPCLLALIGHVAQAQLPKILKLLVTCSVRFLIVGGLGGGTMEKHYTKVAQKVRAGEIASAADVLSAMREVSPNNAEFQEAFSRATVSQGHLARYYLRMLEIEAGGEKEPQHVPNQDERVITLEHVLPESPGKEWRLDPDLMQAYYRRIGNLALLPKTPNELAGNEGYRSTKRAILKRSNFKLTFTIAENEEWGFAQIDKRQKELAELAVKAWPLRV